jgi:hypothetical protein
MTLDYDEAADVLYITFRVTSSPCRYTEGTTGAVLRIDTIVGDIVGCTIPFFSRHIKEGEFRVPEIPALPALNSFRVARRGLMRGKPKARAAS